MTIPFPRQTQNQAGSTKRRITETKTPDTIEKEATHVPELVHGPQITGFELRLAPFPGTLKSLSAKEGSSMPSLPTQC